LKNEAYAIIERRPICFGRTKPNSRFGQAIGRRINRLGQRLEVAHEDYSITSWLLRTFPKSDKSGAACCLSITDSRIGREGVDGLAIDFMDCNHCLE
jgi:hypothetical protein